MITPHENPSITIWPLRFALTTGSPSSRYVEFIVIIIIFVQGVKLFTANIYYYIRPSLITRNVTLALQHMEVLCYNGLNLCIRKGLYGEKL